jgi:hypothetical protein
MFHNQVEQMLQKHAGFQTIRSANKAACRHSHAGPTGSGAKRVGNKMGRIHNGTPMHLTVDVKSWSLRCQLDHTGVVLCAVPASGLKDNPQTRQMAAERMQSTQRPTHKQYHKRGLSIKGSLNMRVLWPEHYWTET